jgi:maltose/maltodextrin transport system substrate-binding protein
MKILFAFFFSIVLTSIFAQSPDYYKQLCEQSRAESLLPVRPGKVGEQPFWNEKAVMFKYAPSFLNDKSSWIIPEPKYFRYSAFSFVDNKYYTFTADSPYEALTPIWDKLPNGEVYVKVEAVSADEKDFLLAGSRSFTKTASFCPPYARAKYSYKMAVEKGLHFMYNQPHILNWLKTGKPDHESHKLYCYSALEVGSVVNAMLLYNSYYSENDSSIRIAMIAADYIIANSEPAGSPLQFFPKVYEGTNMFAGNYKGEVILSEPASTGMSFLALYEKTGNKKYLEAAVHIAETYQKIQLESGTWFIRLYKDTGLPASQEFCIPINIVNFLSMLTEKYQYAGFQQMIDSAIGWIWANPMKTYNWTGQFEDVSAAKPYHNLSKYEASWFAQYLVKNSEQDKKYISLAKELTSFCEDQFVVWENPGIYDNWGNSSLRWHTPAALEQYMCYVPIDASAVQLINTFYSIYEKTKEPIYLEKALALANSLVNSQIENGMIPTFWVPGFEEFWNNCMVSSLTMLGRLSGIDNKHVR